MTVEENRGAARRSPLPAAFGMAARGVCLAAAPTFAVMALLTGIDEHRTMLCAAGPAASPLTGMAAMYLLMAVFHAPPWLRVFDRPPAPR